MEKDYRPLFWSNIHGPGLTPDLEGEAECEYGWLKYLPQKQERYTRGSLIVPLTKHARAALDFLAQFEHAPDDRILAWPQSALTFRNTFRKICKKAGVFPREGCGKDYFQINHFRKGATSEINNHRPGMAPYIVGHASERSATASIVSDTHYDRQEKRVLECLMTLPMPECFDSILSA